MKRDCNMMLTPLFTSPLDTAIGLERTTCQLVDVEVKDGQYLFGFENLKRWIDLCKKCGIEYFEMSHLFSQWGAKYAPKVVATVNGKKEKIFGWHTPAVGEYTKFLESFLPQLTAKLREWGIADATYFHISDEPREEHLESYKAAKESLGNMLDGFHTFDALSSYEFYRHGLIDKPVPGNNEIEEFLANGLTDMWTYYCTGQFYEVSNRFMSMPSARNRIYGVQLYKYECIFYDIGNCLIKLLLRYFVYSFSEQLLNILFYFFLKRFFFKSRINHIVLILSCSCFRKCKIKEQVCRSRPVHICYCFSTPRVTASPLIFHSFT